MMDEKNITPASEEIIMDLETAKAKDAIIGRGLKDAGAALLDIRDQKGYLALGFKLFKEYCQSIQDRYGSQSNVYRLMQHTEVERNISRMLKKPVALSAVTHSETLAQLPSPEAQAEVYAEVTNTKSMLPPTDREWQRAVAAWRKKHGIGRTAPKISYGWDEDDLKEDRPLAESIKTIGKVYGAEIRTAITTGVIEIPRADLLRLASLDRDTMQEVENLLIEERWSLKQALAFLKTQPTEKSSVADLHNYCLTQKNRKYEATINGFHHVVTRLKRD